MKKIISLLFLIAIACSSKDAIQQEFPMPIADYYYTTKGNQTVFTIELKQPISGAIEMQTMFFRYQNSSVKEISKNIFAATFSTPDLVMDVDPKEEAVNQLPNVKEFPIQLKPTEAVLEYKHKGKTKRYLFSNVVEKSNQ
ncbi:hypothetical protein [Flavobacterium sp.]|jgi:hypothetical protein|uniref:hypothetical protein n=1 Tax=Flavobacterium sp. TaxID=239 RepID=UPI0037BE619C